MTPRYTRVHFSQEEFTWLIKAVDIRARDIKKQSERLQKKRGAQAIMSLYKKMLAPLPDLSLDLQRQDLRNIQAITKQQLQACMDITIPEYQRRINEHERFRGYLERSKKHASFLAALLSKVEREL